MFEKPCGFVCSIRFYGCCVLLCVVADVWAGLPPGAYQHVSEDLETRGLLPMFLCLPWVFPGDIAKANGFANGQGPESSGQVFGTIVQNVLCKLIYFPEQISNHQISCPAQSHVLGCCSPAKV
jgi:hypothetical protein